MNPPASVDNAALCEGLGDRFRLNIHYFIWKLCDLLHDTLFIKYCQHKFNETYTIQSESVYRIISFIVLHF